MAYISFINGLYQERPDRYCAYAPIGGRGALRRFACIALAVAAAPRRLQDPNGQGL